MRSLGLLMAGAIPLLLPSSPLAFDACMDYSRTARRVASLELPGRPETMALDGDFVYVADHLRRVHILDVSRPASPSVAGSFATAWGVSGMDASGGILCLAARDLLVYDVSDPRAPDLLATLPLPGDVGKVVLAGSLAYVTASGLRIVDLADPASPQQLGSAPLPSDARSLAVEGDHVYVVDDAWDPYELNGLRILDVSDPAAPFLLSELELSPENYDVAVSGGYVFVVTYADMKVVDARDPLAPVVVASLDRGHPQAVTLAGKLALVSVSEGLAFVDVSDPSSPMILGMIESDGGLAAVAPAEGFVYTAAGTEFGVIRTPARLFAPLVGAVELPGEPLDVTVAGGHAFVPSYGEGLMVIDVTSPGEPWIAGTAGAADIGPDVAVSGSLVLVAGVSAGLQVIDVSDPQGPTVVGQVNTPGEGLGVAVSGSLAFVADGPGLQAIDISPVESAHILQNVLPGRQVTCVAATPDLVVAAGHMACWAVDPISLEVVGELATSGTVWDVGLSGDFAYLADETAGLVLVDLAEPAAPVAVGTLALPGLARDVTVHGRTAYVGQWFGGVVVADITRPALPRLLGDSDAPLTASGVSVDGGLLYVSDSSRGLLVLPSQCQLPFGKPEALAGGSDAGRDPIAAARVGPNPVRRGAPVEIETPAIQGFALEIFDVTGRRVRRMSVPYGRVTWDGRDESGREVASGVYFVRTAVSTGGAIARLVVLP